MYLAPGQVLRAPGDKILMSTERPYHFTHLLQVSINFFHDFIHIYSPEAGGIQSPEDKVLMSTETSCHFGHLLLVSNHRLQQFLKNPLFHLFPIQKIFLRFLPYIGMAAILSRDLDRLNKFSFSHPMEAPYEI